MEFVATAVCKSLRGIGLSQRKEHAIEDSLLVQLRSNGSDFVLNRLSDLKDWRLMHMQGNIDYHPTWFKFKTRHGACIPSDKLGSQLWQLNDRAFLAVVGAISSAVLYTEVTEKQAQKWIGGVRCANASEDKTSLRLRLSEKALDKLESRIRANWSKRKWFGVSDVTGSNIPGQGKFMMVKTIDESGLTKDPLTLLRAYSFSMSTAPLFTWQFLEDIKAYDLVDVSGDEPARTDSDRLKLQETRTKLRDVVDSHRADESLHDIALGGEAWSDWSSDEAWSFDNEGNVRTKYYDSIFGFEGSVGNIGFLQQKKGKLRTVANPNRFVQWCNVPLGEVWSDFFYKQAGCYVLNQQAGISWAQDKLRKGTKLASFDMSSATDMLDYQKFLHEFFAKMDEEKHPILSRSIDLFIDTSSSPWHIPGHIADVINAHGNKVSWSVGQPLGLRPSFPLLTIMNMQCAKEAILEVDGEVTANHFACVGDDLIIEAKYADAYMRKVRAFNGVINNDKSLSSDRVAEFCSQLITRNTSYPLKPRYIDGIDGYLSNIQKFQSSGVHPRSPKWAYELYDSLSKYHLEGSKNIQFSHSSTPAPLVQRVAAELLLNSTKRRPRDTERVSLQALYLRALEKSHQVTEASDGSENKILVKDLSSSYATSAYESFGGPAGIPVEQHPTYDNLSQVAPLEAIASYPSATSTSVDVPVIRSWDHKEDRYRKPSSETDNAKKLSKLLSKSNISSDSSGLTEASVLDKFSHDRITVLVDTQTDDPQVLIARENASNPAANSIDAGILGRTGETVTEDDVDQAIADALTSVKSNKSKDSFDRSL